MPYAVRNRATAVGTCFVAKQLVPDELWTIIEPLLPPEPLEPNGGRTRVPNRAAFAGIIYVLRSGIPWRMLPKGSGAGLDHLCLLSGTSEDGHQQPHEQAFDQQR